LILIDIFSYRHLSVVISSGHENAEIGNTCRKETGAHEQISPPGSRLALRNGAAVFPAVRRIWGSNTTLFHNGRNTAMDIITPLNAAISGVTLLRDITGAFIDERDREKLAALKIKLTEQILHLQSELLQVQAAVIEQNRLVESFQKRVAELECAQTVKSRYRLAKVGSVGNFIAYRLRPVSEVPENAGEPEHFVCQPCFDAGKRVVLIGYGGGYWRCPVCKTGVSTERD
jgi:hypothetical protein